MLDPGHYQHSCSFHTAPIATCVCRPGQGIDEILPRLLTEPILVEACPGAGKTHFGLEVVSGLPILHTCGHRKLHTWRFDLAGGRVGM